MIQRPLWLFLGLLLAISAGANSAYADDGGIYSGIKASVDIGRYRTDFAYPGGNYQVDVNYYGLVIVQPVSSEAGFGWLIGYQTTSMDNPSLYSLNDGFGPFAGFYLDWQPELNSYWNLDLRVGYTWHDMSYSSTDQQPNQQADLTWYTSYVFLGPMLHYGRWRFSVGGTYQYISGTETDNGTVNQKLDFSATHSTGAYVGIMYYLSYTGSFGIYAMGGANQGVGLVFKQEF